MVEQCHWPVNDPVTAAVQGRRGPRSGAAHTRKTCWQAAGTRWNIHLHFKEPSEEQSCKATEFCCGEGLRWGGGGVGGCPSQPCSTVWLSSSLAQMLLSSHKLFTSGYTKENSCTDCGWRVSHKPAALPAPPLQRPGAPACPPKAPLGWLQQLWSPKKLH